MVLAGGKSSRMGRPKAMLPFDGAPLIVHIVALLRRSFDDIVVVAAPGQDLPILRGNVVRDVVADQGPVGGLCYGLRAAATDVSFVTACDAPFLNGELVSHLVSQLEGYDAVVPCWGGRLQPLPAVYKRTVLPVVEEQLARGDLKIAALFDRVRTRRIDEAEVRRFDPGGDSFFNINTPNDYAAALERWRRRG